MLLRYCGGKSKKSVVQKLLSYAPKNYSSYFEPFAGGAGLFWHIPISVPRWINDIDSNLISLYNALKTRPDQFIALCRTIEPQRENEPLTSSREGGRAIHNARLKAKFDELLKDPQSDPALKYFFVNRVNYAGRMTYDLPSRLYFSNPQGWNIIKGNALEKSAEKLKDAKITCGDYNTLLEAPEKDVWVYLDPPYYEASKLSRMSQLYAHNFTEQDHIILAQRIKNCPHKILISYDDDPFIRDLYKGFNIFEEQWTYCGSSQKKKKIGKELIITNYSVQSPKLEEQLFEER